MSAGLEAGFRLSIHKLELVLQKGAEELAQQLEEQHLLRKQIAQEKKSVSELNRKNDSLFKAILQEERDMNLLREQLKSLRSAAPHPGALTNAPSSAPAPKPQEERPEEWLKQLQEMREICRSSMLQ